MKSFIQCSKASESTKRKVERYILKGWKPREPLRDLLNGQRRVIVAGVGR